jgi:hypothetical protein
MEKPQIAARAALANVRLNNIVIPLERPEGSMEGYCTRSALAETQSKEARQSNRRACFVRYICESASERYSLPVARQPPSA